MTKEEADELLSKIKPISKDKPYFGEVYKTYIIHIFKIYEEIINSDLSIEQQKSEFEKRVSQYLIEHKEYMRSLMFEQVSDKTKLNLFEEEVHRGSETLTFETVGNLYNIFIKDVDIVSNDSEGKMYTTVPNGQRIFEEPPLDEEGNVKINPNLEFNFEMLRETFDFAKKHGKQIKFHTFLWHNAVPENLRAEIDVISDPNLKRKMVLAFLDDYANKLADFLKENGYNLRQIEGLNEIASDTHGDSNSLRSSWWKDVIGKNSENGDEYFIDVLKILKKHFPDTEILYNEYSEFVGEKTNRICDIINQVKIAEKRDGLTLLDGIGAQAHYTDVILGKNGQAWPLTAREIIESAIKLQEVCDDKKIYITEYDFNDYLRNGSKENLEKVFIEVYSKISNGFITWGNSDALTWFHCIDRDGKPLNSHIVDSKGEKKGVFTKIKEAFAREREERKKYGLLSLRNVGKGTVNAYEDNPQAAENAINSLDKSIETEKDNINPQGE